MKVQNNAVKHVCCRIFSVKFYTRIVDAHIQVQFLLGYESSIIFLKSLNYQSHVILCIYPNSKTLWCVHEYDTVMQSNLNLNNLYQVRNVIHVYKLCLMLSLRLFVSNVSGIKLVFSESLHNYSL